MILKINQCHQQQCSLPRDQRVRTCTQSCFVTLIANFFSLPPVSSVTSVSSVEVILQANTAPRFLAGLLRHCWRRRSAAHVNTGCFRCQWRRRNSSGTIRTILTLLELAEAFTWICYTLSRVQWVIREHPSGKLAGIYLSVCVDFS